MHVGTAQVSNSSTLRLANTPAMSTAYSKSGTGNETGDGTEQDGGETEAVKSTTLACGLRARRSFWLIEQWFNQSEHCPDGMPQIAATSGKSGQRVNEGMLPQCIPVEGDAKNARTAVTLGTEQLLLGGLDRVNDAIMPSLQQRQKEGCQRHRGEEEGRRRNDEKKERVGIRHTCG